MDNNFSRNLKNIRENRKISQQYIADKMNVDRSTIGYWESGKVDPSMANVVKLSEVLQVDIISLIGGNFDFDNTTLIDKNENKIKIPVLGKIPAGVPFEAIEDQYIVDYEFMPNDMIKPGNKYFALVLDGDSMEPEYHDKDRVIFKQTSDCESGQDCCIRINGHDATFKRIKKQENGVMIIPLNENNSTGFTSTFYTNEDIEKMPIEILGVVKRVIRNK